MEKHCLELLLCHPLEHVPRGPSPLHLSSELWTEVVPQLRRPTPGGGRGVFPGEFMGFSGWFFNHVLFVCCLVWGCGVGSPRNVGLGSTEGLSGALEGRRQKTDVETGRFSDIRGRGFGC